MANPRIVLIKPPSVSVEDDRVEPPLGLLYVASNLRAAGFDDVHLYDMSGCKDEQEIAARIKAIPDADVFGINVYCTTHEYAKLSAQEIRSRGNEAYILVGGPNPTGVPEFTLDDMDVDVAVVGEGEDAFVNCLDSYSSGRPFKGILHATPRSDIDSYPFPARDLADYSTYTRRLMGKPVVSLLSSRGCVHHCIHCNSVVVGGGMHNVRYRSPQNVAAELEQVKDMTGGYVRFNDDCFTGNPDLTGVLDAIKNQDVKFRIFACVEDLTQEASKALGDAGCVHLSIGLESMDPENLRAIGKTRQLGKEGNIRIAKDHGLAVRSSFMVGLPNDSDENIERYFSEAAKLGIDEFAVYPLIPYPGTAIARFPERFGYKITDPNFTKYVQMGKGGQACFALRHKNFDENDVKRWLDRASEILEAGGAKHMRESQIAR